MHARWQRNGDFCLVQGKQPSHEEVLGASGNADADEFRAHRRFLHEFFDGMVDVVVCLAVV